MYVQHKLETSTNKLHEPINMHTGSPQTLGTQKLPQDPASNKGKTLRDVEPW